MKGAAVLFLLAVVAAPALAQAPTGSPTGTITDADILNLALNLEYLEAEFYSCASSGSPIPDELRGGGPASTGCQKAQLDGNGQAYAAEIAADELNHVKLLRQALGSAAVPIPQLNIGTAFSDAANAAIGQTLSPPFSPYLNDLFFYHGAFIFEDVGVTAYLGAAPSIQDAQTLETAAKILAIEAYHAGAIRTLLFQQRETETPYNVTVADIVDAISALRGKVGGGDDQGITVDSSNGQEANIAPADSNGLAFARTPDEIIEIVTLGAGPSGGGFFPNGLNGAFGPGGSAGTAPAAAPTSSA